MNQERYTVGELATAAATTPRTIRFYTTEGLLPPPLTEGRNAIYSETHRRRLRLIQRLKAAYLPLSAIKDQMSGLTDEQVDALLERSGPHRVEFTGTASHGSRPHAPQPPAESGTVAYVAQILAAANQALVSNPDNERTEGSKRVLLISPTLRPDNDSDAVSEDGSVDGHRTYERWERISLYAGIELHVREPLSTTHRALVDRLVIFARGLFPDAVS